MGKIKYVKCPRCDLNYMDSRQEYCDFCKAELGMKSNLVIEDDDEDVGLDEELTKLCPICKRVYIGIDEDMCDACAAAKGEDAIDENDEEWRNYMDDDPDEYVEEKIEIPLDELQEEEEEEEEEEEVAPVDDFEDDFDYSGDPDDYDEDDDDDYDDDEDDDYDDDEDEDKKPRRKSTRK